MTLLDFSGWRRPSPDWSNQQLGEFYRVESALTQARIPVEIDRGVTDEGDPWLVFAHMETGDIIAHFARERGVYIAAVPSVPWVSRGSDLRALIAEFMRSHPVLLPSKEEKKGNVLLHPAALFTAFVATAFYLEGFRVSDAHADERKAFSGGSHQASSEATVAGGDVEWKYLSQVALLAAVAVALEVARDHLWSPNLDLLAGPAPDGAEDIKAILIATIDKSQDFDAPIDGSPQGSLPSALVSAPVNAEPQMDEAEFQSQASTRTEDTDKSVPLNSPVAGSIAAETPASSASPVSESSNATVVEHSREGSTEAALLGPKAQVANGGEHSGATAASGAAVLSFLFEKAPQTINFESNGRASIDQVLNWTDQAPAAAHSPQSGPHGNIVPASGEANTPSANPFIQKIVFNDEVRLDLIGEFLRSDTDIITLVGKAAIVIYDESELTSGSGEIEIQTWKLSDAQSVSIIGSATFFDHYYATHPVA